jgi:hypothetical protein
MAIRPRHFGQEEALTVARTPADSPEVRVSGGAERWRTIRYALDSWSRTARLCLIVLVMVRVRPARWEAGLDPLAAVSGSPRGYPPHKLGVMKGDYRKLGAWLAGSGATLAGGYLIARETAGHSTPIWPYLIFMVMFLLGGSMLFWSSLRARLAPQPAQAETAPDGQQEIAGPALIPSGHLLSGVPLARVPPAVVTAPASPARSALTSAWRYTQVGFEISTLANIGTKGFTHPAYMRQTEETPPAVRIGMLVACSSLGDEPTAEELRSRFRTLLSESFREMIAELTDVGPDTRWQSQPGRGRFSLEADLTGADPAEVPVASAMLLVPVAGQAFYGRDPKCFTMALALPNALARFLEDLGLTTSDDPPVKFTVQVQARPLTASMTEIVDVRSLTPISEGRMSVQFDGWAVARADGETAGAISKRFIRQMCEDMGREGYEDILADLPA